MTEINIDVAPKDLYKAKKNIIKIDYRMMLNFMKQKKSV